MDEATIGARLRILRRWRGMTQAELAGLAGLSPSFLSMVETGLRSLDRRSHIAAVASVLRVSETDLVGGPHLSADKTQSDPHAAIPGLREALQVNRLEDPAADQARPLGNLAREVTGHIEPMRAEADYAGAGALLPAVLDELYWHAAHARDEAGRRARAGRPDRGLRHRRADSQGPGIHRPGPRRGAARGRGRGITG